MASPQIENGYLKIANKIVDALCQCSLGHTENQLLWAILRKTYGWHKKKDSISIGQLVSMTGKSRRMVIYALQNLEAKRMITIKRQRGQGIKNEINEICFQKNYDLWVVQEKSEQYDKALKKRKELYQKSKSGVVQEIKGSARNGKKVVQETVNDVLFLAPTKDIITKDIITKDKEIFLPKDISNELWKEFKKYRIKMKAPLSDYAEKLMVKKLVKFKAEGYNPIDLINKTIERGWKDINPDWIYKNNGGKNAKPEKFAEKKYIGTDISKIPWAQDRTEDMP